MLITSRAAVMQTSSLQLCGQSVLVRVYKLRTVTVFAIFFCFITQSHKNKSERKKLNFLASVAKNALIQNILTKCKHLVDQDLS